VTGNNNVQTAAQKSKAFATLATRENTKASDFGRKLFSGEWPVQHGILWQPSNCMYQSMAGLTLCHMACCPGA
jgi:hypothetical protein